MNATDPHQLLGAYLLGGLEPEEAALFEQHLGRCPECRRELDELASLPALPPRCCSKAAASSGSRPPSR